MFYTYIQENLKGKLYKGHTSNITQRRIQHLLCSTEYSKRFGPSKLVYFESYKSKKLAIKRERFFKTGKGRQFIKLFLKRRSALGGL